MATPVNNSPRFAGSPLDLLLKTAPTSQKVLAGILKLSESTQGVSHTKFTQDTLSVWFPKAVVTRSLAEFTEMSFLEFVESALFYYSASIVGQGIFQHLFHRVSPSAFPKQLISKPLSELAKHSPQLVNKVLPIKAAVILSSIGIFTGEYALSFAKNLLTEKVFRKSSFSDVVNLSHGKVNHNEETPAAKKAYKRIGQCIALAGGIVGASLLLARFGARLPKLRPVTETFVKFFDFSFNKGQFGLSKTQLRAIIFAGVISYMDAARDRLEKAEVATRLAIVAPYLAFGDDLLQGTMVKLFGKRFPQLIKQAPKATHLEDLIVGKLFGQKAVSLLNAKHTVKSLEELTAESLQQARTLLSKQYPGKLISNALIEKEAAKGLKPLLRSKNILFMVPTAVGIIGVGLGTALLNRFWTAYRFKHQQKPSALQQNPGLQQDLSFVHQVARQPQQHVYSPYAQAASSIPQQAFGSESYLSGASATRWQGPRYFFPQGAAAHQS